MKTFLLTLGFALICASSQFDPAEVTGNWHTIFMAANHVEKIEQGGDLRVYLRHLECIDGCHNLVITFYTKLNTKCEKFSVMAIKGANGVYETNYLGDNSLEIKYVSNGAILFYNKHVDADGKVTYKTVIAAKEDSLSEEQKKKFEELTVENNIPKENIRNIIETDDCPAA